MLSKHSDFKPGVCFSRLSRIYNTASLIIANREDRAKCSALIEKRRSLYRMIPRGSFTGLGAYPWQTSTGYAGVTALVYHKERNAVLSCSASMADFYEKTQDAGDIRNLANAYKKGGHWDGSVSLQTISRYNCTLRNFKRNDEGRLSASKGTFYSSLEKTSSDDCKAAAGLLSETEADDESPAYDYFGKKGSRLKYRIIYASGIVSCEYDEVNQMLSFGLCGRDETCQAFIPYSEINLTAIKYIEGLAAGESFPGCWFVCVQDYRGFIPLSMVSDKGVENFYFKD
jgi:hypothetical protein